MEIDGPIPSDAWGPSLPADRLLVESRASTVSQRMKTELKAIATRPSIASRHTCTPADFPERARTLPRMLFDRMPISSGSESAAYFHTLIATAIDCQPIRRIGAPRAAMMPPIRSKSAA